MARLIDWILLGSLIALCSLNVSCNPFVVSIAHAQYTECSEPAPEPNDGETCVCCEGAWTCGSDIEEEPG
jgi:hypothetical protein